MRPKSMKDVKSTSETSLREDGPAATRRVRGLRDVMSSRKVAGRSVPAMIPGFSRNCRRASSTIRAAARPTAVMAMPPKR